MKNKHKFIVDGLIKYAYKIKMTNNTEYVCFSCEEHVREFIKEVFGNGKSDIVLYLAELSDKEIVVINTKYISSIEI